VVGFRAGLCEQEHEGSRRHARRARRSGPRCDRHSNCKRLRATGLWAWRCRSCRTRAVKYGWRWMRLGMSRCCNRTLQRRSGDTSATQDSIHLEAEGVTQVAGMALVQDNASWSAITFGWLLAPHLVAPTTRRRCAVSNTPIQPHRTPLAPAIASPQSRRGDPWFQPRGAVMREGSSFTTHSVTPSAATRCTTV
jgi:hypothetical protein